MEPRNIIVRWGNKYVLCRSVEKETGVDAVAACLHDSLKYVQELKNELDKKYPIVASSAKRRD